MFHSVFLLLFFFRFLYLISKNEGPFIDSFHKLCVTYKNQFSILRGVGLQFFCFCLRLSAYAQYEINVKKIKWKKWGLHEEKDII